jgi:hypothetical protein
LDRYIATYIVLFLYCKSTKVKLSVFLSLFISLVEEAYVVVKIKNKTSWVQEYIKIEPKHVDLKLHSKKSLLITKEYFKNFRRQPTGLSRSLKSHDLFVKRDSYTEMNKLEPIRERSFRDVRQAESLGEASLPVQLVDFSKKERVVKAPTIGGVKVQNISEKVKIF